MDPTLSPGHFPVDGKAPGDYSSRDGTAESPPARHGVARRNGRLAPLPATDPLVPTPNRVTPVPQNSVHMIRWRAHLSRAQRFSSMATLTLLLASVLNGSGALTLQPPAIEWQHVYGVPGLHDRLTAMAPTADGGFLLGGVSTDLNDGYLDWLVVRVNASGQELWRRTFGGSDEDELESIAATPDGGFILGGISSSPADGNKTSPYLGGLGDCWVVRLDADGNKLWERTYGGSGRERLWAIRPLPDGGYVFGGASTSTDGTKESPYYGGFEDGWIVRLDAAGDVLWERSYGGAGEDNVNDIQPTADGGFIAVAYSSSPTNEIKSAPGFGDWDFWVLRLDGQGQRLWDRAYGGTSRDFPCAVQVMPEGGYAIAGGTWSDADGNKLSTNHAAVPFLGSADYWLLRLDAAGQAVWEAEYGGRSEDVPTSLQPTTDGGFLLGGFTLSGEGGNKTSGSHGEFDYWVVRTDSSGHRLWDETFGGNESDYLGALLQAHDGGFVLGGYSRSGVRGNKTVPNTFGEDFWVLRLAPDALTARPRLRWEPCCMDDVGPQYSLLLRGSPGLTYRVEFSTNLVDWTRLREIQAAEAEVEVFSSSVDFQPMRFFRAVLSGVSGVEANRLGCPAQSRPRRRSRWRGSYGGRRR
jgi:hypothetical protein